MNGVPEGEERGLKRKIEGFLRVLAFPSMKPGCGTVRASEPHKVRRAKTKGGKGRI